MSGLVRNSTPTDTDIVSLSDLKTFMRVDGSDEDTLIAVLFTAARQMVEKYTNVSMSDTASNYTLTLDEWPDDGVIRLSVGPVTAVASVKYYDSDDVQQTMVVDTDYYASLKRKPGEIVMVNTPNVKNKPDAIEVIFTAGYDEASVPETLVQAIQMITLNLYERRGDGQANNAIITTFPMPFQIQALMDTEKLGGYG